MSNPNLEYLCSMEAAISELIAKHKGLATESTLLDTDAVNTLGEEIAYINREHKRLCELESTPEDHEFAYRREDAGHLAHRIELATSEADTLQQALQSRKSTLPLCA